MPVPDDTTLGAELRDRRLELGLSVRAVAARAGISPAYVTALETGNSPSTGRPPVPSVAIVRRLAGALDLDVGRLVGTSAAASHRPAHILAYVAAPPPEGLFRALDALLGDGVDHWLHIADPRTTAIDDARRATTRRFLLGAPPYATRHLDPDALVDAVDRAVADLAARHHGEQVGLLIADCSAVMRYLHDAAREVELEATWHGHVHRIWCERLGTEPAIDVCAYHQADLSALGLTIDQLATALELIGRHDDVVVLDGARAITGAPAIRRILEEVRPPGASPAGWARLAAAASRTLAVPAHV